MQCAVLTELRYPAPLRVDRSRHECPQCPDQCTSPCRLFAAARQVITIAGVFFQIVYLWYYDKWAAVVPLSIELCFLLCLLGLKFRLEYNPKGAALGDGQD